MNWSSIVSLKFALAATVIGGFAISPFVTIQSLSGKEATPHYEFAQLPLRVVYTRGEFYRIEARVSNAWREVRCPSIDAWICTKVFATKQLLPRKSGTHEILNGPYEVLFDATSIGPYSAADALLGRTSVTVYRIAQIPMDLELFTTKAQQ